MYFTRATHERVYARLSTETITKIQQDPNQPPIFGRKIREVNIPVPREPIRLPFRQFQVPIHTVPRIPNILETHKIVTRKDWRKWLLENHPDKGGDGELCGQILIAGKAQG